MDYSYRPWEARPTSFINAPNITGYINGVLAWGTEPNRSETKKGRGDEQTPRSSGPSRRHSSKAVTAAFQARAFQGTVSRPAVCRFLSPRIPE